MAAQHYIIRGGLAGRERLRLVGRVMRPSTLNLLERVGVQPGMACLDLGCGGGDVTCDLARLVGDHGRVVGTDIDATKLALAQDEAREQQLGQIEFRLGDAMSGEAAPIFDLVYARFLLTHLPDPASALQQMVRFVRPGGVVVVEDIDFAGHFCYPASPAYSRYVELYVQTAQRRGVDPNIGPRLPVLLLDAALENVQMQVVQPAGLTGEVKLLNPITMENIADAVIAEGLASATEVQHLIDELYAFAHHPRTVTSVVRVVQSWGYRTQAG